VISQEEYEESKKTLLGSQTPSVQLAPSSHAGAGGDPEESSSRRALWIVVALVIVAALVLLGLMAGGVFSHSKSSAPATSTTQPPVATTTTRTHNIAAQASCNADAKIAIVADMAYTATGNPNVVESGITPGIPSTYPKGHLASTLVHDGYLNAWPSDVNGYAIALSTTTAGSVVVYVPANNPVGVEYTNQTNACDSL
jgi:hypothetical protein